MSKNTTKTLAFAKMEILRSLTLPYTVDQYSTLNEKFDIGNITPPPNGYPDLKYLAIGNRGTKNAGIGNLVNIQRHSPKDAALFEHIPFVMVPVNQDLTIANRLKYRIRKLETYNGVDYFAYYLKVVDFNSATISTKTVDIVDGVRTETPYEPSVTSLTPSPVVISNTEVNTVNSRHLITSAVITVALDSTDITNIIEACRIKYNGDIREAMLSELAIVGGYDIDVSNSLGGLAASYKEVRCAQIMVHMCSIHYLQTEPEGAEFKFGLTNSLALPPVNLL